MSALSSVTASLVLSHRAAEETMQRTEDIELYNIECV